MGRMLVNGVRISTIIFDWSGTVSDDRPLVFEAASRVRQRHGLPPITLEEFLADIKLTAAEGFAAWGIPGTREELSTLYAKVVEEVKREGIHPTPYDDAEEALQELVRTGVRLAVLSSHPHDHLTREAEKFGLRGHFQTIEGDCHDKVIGILDILIQLGIKEPEAVLYIGDTIWDIRAAKGAGVASAGIATGYTNSVQLLMEEPDLFFYNLKGVAKTYRLAVG